MVADNRGGTFKETLVYTSTACARLQAAIPSECDKEGAPLKFRSHALIRFSYPKQESVSVNSNLLDIFTLLGLRARPRRQKQILLVLF